MSGYLVAFVVDPVDDEMAGAIRAAVRELAGAREWEVSPPGFFDDPGADDAAERTTGAYLRPRAPAEDVAALCAMVGSLSREHGMTWEVQLAEIVIGRVRAGEPDLDLVRALPGFAG